MGKKNYRLHKHISRRLPLLHAHGGNGCDCYLKTMGGKVTFTLVELLELHPPSRRHTIRK